MAYFKRRKKGKSKAVPLNAEAQRAIHEQLRNFREKFGRDAGPEDPIFFDPDADTPQPVSKAGLDEMTGQILSAAGKAGVGLNSSMQSGRQAGSSRSQTSSC